MAVNKTEHLALERLVARITESRQRDRWRLSADDLAGALDIDMVALYRGIYQNPRAVSFGEAIDGFDQERVGELVTLLEELGYRSAEDHLYRAGLFVPLKAGTRVTDHLVRRYVRALRAHKVEWERIAYGLGKGRGYREVAWNYLSQAVPVEPLAEEVVAQFLQEEGIPAEGRWSYLGYLRTLRKRHLLDYAILGASFYEEVYRYAVAEGYIRPRAQESRYGRAAGAGEREKPGSGGRARFEEKGIVEWARSLLGVGEAASREDVQRAYRREMLRYHPDVNPTGAEVAKELNAAYAALLGSIGDSR